MQVAQDQLKMKGDCSNYCVSICRGGHANSWGLIGKQCALQRSSMTGGIFGFHTLVIRGVPGVQKGLPMFALLLAAKE